jgi:hypothetical protein
LSTHHPSVGLVNQTFDIFLARDAAYDGAPSDPNEAAMIEWRSYECAASDLKRGVISDGFSQLGVSLAIGAIGRGDLLARQPNESEKAD